MNNYRTAVVSGRDVTLERVRAYMPANYSAYMSDDSDDDVIVTGQDYAGWTLDNYVIPRLASGGMVAIELDVEPGAPFATVEARNLKPHDVIRAPGVMVSGWATVGSVDVDGMEPGFVWVMRPDGSAVARLGLSEIVEVR